MVNISANYGHTQTLGVSEGRRAERKTPRLTCPDDFRERLCNEEFMVLQTFYFELCTNARVMKKDAINDNAIIPTKKPIMT